MSFFKDIKEEIDQPEVATATIDKEAVTEEMVEDGIDEDLLSNILESENAVTEEKVATVKENVIKSEPVVAEESVVVERVVTTEITSAKEARLSILEERRASQESKQDVDTESTTVITKGTTINGSIISDCSLDVMGTINGDIECLGKLTISGKVRGNSLASEVFVNTDRLEGCITSEGSVKIGLGTVIVGDVYATSGVIAGAVKGEIDIKGPVIIDSTAIIKGNVKAKSVQMNNGAVLEGFCSLAYADFEIEDVFE